VKAAIKHDKREMLWPLASEIKQASADEVDMERRNGLPWKQWHEFGHVSHPFKRLHRSRLLSR
ncbi:MAG TPA: hypothetical protein VF957_23200, partial [Bradyrhizobium sp.]